MSIAAHEARHAAAAMELGLEVLEARVDNPTPDRAGHVLHMPADARDDALVTLAGFMGDDGWPPPWPPRADRSSDERRLAQYVDSAGLNEVGWKDLCAAARELVAGADFEAKQSVIEALLDHGCVLDGPQLKQINKATARSAMEHKTVEASARVTSDLGEFSAIAAAYTVDRQGDQIVRGAFEKTIARWQMLRRKVPLHWDHRGGTENVIGAADPASMREIDEGLYVRGKLDLQESTLARDAWRAMKTGSVALSFGYMAPRSRMRRDGVRELTEIDLFEISLTPAPANADTRIIEMKSARRATRGASRSSNDPAALSPADVRKHAAEVGIDLPLTRAEWVQAHRPAPPMSLLPRGWEDYRPPRRLSELDPDELMARHLRRRSDRIRLEAALGFDQRLIDELLGGAE
jgi:uncharacterized protein